MSQNSILNETGKFGGSSSSSILNLSMTDNKFTIAYINEKYNNCPICGCNILDSYCSTHLSDFHNIGFYREMLKKMKEKAAIIKKEKEELKDLCFLFETYSKKSVVKPSPSVLREYYSIFQE